MTRVTVKHLRQANLCSGGARDWFKLHGLSWQKFLDGEMTVEEVEATGDELAFIVSAFAKADGTNGR
ncbi:hypothetical protein [Paracoccus sp. (in: a-proteobacteria)]|uniref:hypothetical protein n=1 Tax=Paracoccus sp. TaxID=267 RepID=UPI0026DEC57D|nr:hypothetical protein [Paracoccus sp. (in: a-proteobacteria)]MDO5646295.1 hypothetical protein [Paracoccus sp. (in: a-proteobacteria)]